MIKLLRFCVLIKLTTLLKNTEYCQQQEQHDNIKMYLHLREVKTFCLVVCLSSSVPYMELAR